MGRGRRGGSAGVARRTHVVTGAGTVGSMGNQVVQGRACGPRAEREQQRARYVAQRGAAGQQLRRALESDRRRHHRRQRADAERSHHERTVGGAGRGRGQQQHRIGESARQPAPRQAQPDRAGQALALCNTPSCRQDPAPETGARGLERVEQSPAEQQATRGRHHDGAGQHAEGDRKWRDVDRAQQRPAKQTGERACERVAGHASDVVGDGQRQARTRTLRRAVAHRQGTRDATAHGQAMAAAGKSGDQRGTEAQRTGVQGVHGLGGSCLCGCRGVVAGAVTRGPALAFIVEHRPAGTVEIVELPAAHGPEEGPQPDSDERQAERHHQVEDLHLCRSCRSCIGPARGCHRRRATRDTRRIQHHEHRTQRHADRREPRRHEAERGQRQRGQVVARSTRRGSA